MREIEKWFHRGSGYLKIFYSLEKRTEKVGLFKLYIEIEPDEFEHVGWEVVRILVNEEKEIFGMTVEKMEVLPCDEKFGMWEMSDKAMFPNEEQRANDYFMEFDEYLSRPKKIA